MPLRIGIDLGGVCSIHARDYEGTGEMKEIINMPGCVEALQQLRKDGHTLVLVSFCGKSRAEQTKKIPEMKLFHEVYFVRDRKYKNQVCHHRALDVLIDDRVDILDTLQCPVKGILFGSFSPDYLFGFKWDDVVKVLSALEPSWNERKLLPVPFKLIY